MPTMTCSGTANRYAFLSLRFSRYHFPLISSPPCTSSLQGASFASCADANFFVRPASCLFSLCAGENRRMVCADEVIKWPAAFRWWLRHSIAGLNCSPAILNLLQLKDSKTEPCSPVVSWLSVEERIQLADLQRSIWRHDLPLCGILLGSISYSGHSAKLRKHERLSRSAFPFDDLGTTPHVVYHTGRMSKVIRITANFPSVFSDCHYESCNIGRCNAHHEIRLLHRTPVFCF